MFDIGAVFDKVWDSNKAIENDTVIIGESKCIEILGNGDIVVPAFIDNIHNLLLNLSLMVEDLRGSKSIDFLKCKVLEYI